MSLSSDIRRVANCCRDGAGLQLIGFARVTDHTRDALKSALNSAIRQGILGYDGNIVWGEA